MTLRTRLYALLLKHETVDQQFQLLADYSRLTSVLIRENDRLEEQNRELRLSHARELQGLVAGWLINLETPEVDMRVELAALVENLGEQIAVLEEHVIT